MLNKIQNNIQCMKAEAKQIVNRQLSPSFKNSSLKHIETIDEKALPPLFMKLKSKNDFMLENKQRIRAKTRISTQPEILNSLSKKNSVDLPSAKSFRTSFMSKDVLALMPVQSELLSTRFYGLYKQKKQIKAIESDIFPKIQSIRSRILAGGSLRMSEDHKDKIQLSRVHKKKGSILFVGELSSRHEKLVRKGKKIIQLKEWLNEETGEKENGKKTYFEDVSVEPWSSIQGDADEFTH